MDAEEIKKLLGRIDEELPAPQTICVIGSTASILMGQPQRNTEDIDVWADASTFDERAMRKAVEAVGLLFNPVDDEPVLPYIQIVHAGIVQVPGYDPADGTWLGQKPVELWRGTNLTIECPPAEAIIASKMRRFSERDITDSIWLMTHGVLDADTIMEAVRRLPERYREEAEENFSVLRLIT